MAKKEPRPVDDIVREGMSVGLTVGGPRSDDDRPRYVEDDERRTFDPTATPAPAFESMPDLTSNAGVLQALVSALQSIASGQQDARSAAQQALEMSARMQQPDNRTAPGISVFNPQGDTQFPRPKLKCRMFLPWQAEEASLTFEEIELLNLLESGEFTLRRNDDSKITVTVRTIVNESTGKPDRLLVNSETAYNNDNHWMMPPLAKMLREVLRQRPSTRSAADQVLTMDERVEAVERGELPVSVGVR